MFKKISKIKVFEPDSKHIMFWDLINVIQIMLCMIRYPILFSFEESFRDDFSFILNFTFPFIISFIEIFVNMNTAFYH